MNPLPVTVGRGAASSVVERNWQSVSKLGIFRVVETVTLEMVNRLWSRDLCATLYVKKAQQMTRQVTQ